MSYNTKFYKAYTLQGSTQYRDIFSVSFYPITEYEKYSIIKLHSKGDKVIKRFLGIKISERTCEEDEYLLRIFNCSWYAEYEMRGTVSYIQKCMAEDNVSDTIMWNGGKQLFKKARVTISYTKDIPTFKYFETNEDAEKYVQEIKEKCEEVGNYLS